MNRTNEKSILGIALQGGKWISIANAATLVSSLLFAGLTIRFLGMQKAGFVAFIGALGSLNASLGGFGLGTVAISVISRQKSDKDGSKISIREVMGTTLFASVAFGCGFLILMILFWREIAYWSDYNGDLHETYFFCVGSGMLFILSQIVNSQRCFLRGYQMFDSLAISTCIQSLLGGTISICVLAISPSLVSYIIAQVGITFFVALQIGISLKKTTGVGFPLLFRLKTFRYMWRESSGVYASSVSSLLADGLDRILLAKIIGVDALPVYTFVRRIYQQIHGILAEQCSFLHPLVSSSQVLGGGAVAGALTKMQWIVTLAAVYAYGLVLIAGPYLLELLISKSFAQAAAYPLLVFTLVGIASSFDIMPFHYANATGKTWMNFMLHFFNGFLALPLMWIGGVLFGFEGAVTGQLCIIAGVILYLSIVKNNKFSIRDLSAYIYPGAHALLFFLVLAIMYQLQRLPNENFTATAYTATFYVVTLTVFVLAYEIWNIGRDGRILTLVRAIYALIKNPSLGEKIVDQILIARRHCARLR